MSFIAKTRKLLVGKLNITLCFVCIACGVEIGNPSNKSDDVPLDTVASSDDLALVANEALSELADLAGANNTQDTAALFLLAPEVSREQSCTENDSGLSLIRKLAISDDTTRGRLERFQRRIVLNHERDETLTYTSNDELIRCANEQYPAINWRTLANFTVSRSYSNKGETEKTLISSGEVLSKKSHERSGEHNITIERLEQNSDQVTIRETHVLQATKALSSTKNDETKSYTMTSTVTPEEPLVIEKTRSQGGLQVKMVSGRQQYLINEVSELSLQYENLVLDFNECIPLSGGLIVTLGEETYNATVSEGQLLLQTADENVVLDIDLCSI